MVSRKEKIFGIVFLSILFIGVTYYSKWYVIFDSKRDKQIQIAWEIRRQKAEKPLQIFNDSIFKWIAFRFIEDLDINRERIEDTNKAVVQNFWFVVKIKDSIYNPKNVPLTITRVYDFKDLNKSRIYRKYQECVRKYSIGDSIIKNYGEDFYRIKFKDPEISTKNEYCDKLYYTTRFDYFWTIKNISIFIDSLYETKK
ncbi:MAG: hypothetical protein LBV71_11465 [Prevotella sp.]|jgi:hypothetical protein|nr:hypothetical protein [Prevotella sp.]